MLGGPKAIVLSAALLGLLVTACSGSTGSARRTPAETPPDRVDEPPAEGGELSPSRRAGEAERLASRAREDLEAVDAILAEPGDDVDEELVATIRDLATQAREALAGEDFERAGNLAHKARTLAEGL